MRYYLIGDTGGHLKELKLGLEAVGVDLENYSIPEDMAIIHLGDLIHRGPGLALEILELVDRLQLRNPGRWIQLMGNHELQHTPGAERFWRCENCSPEVDSLIGALYERGALQIAHGVEDLEAENLTLGARRTFIPESRDWLFTHGGVSRDWIEEFHGGSSGVKELAESIDGLKLSTLGLSGERMGRPGQLASPIWASAPTEVYPSWNGSMPFNQAAGHTYAFDWEWDAWFGPFHRIREFAKHTKLNPQQRLSITKLGDSVLLGADPGFGERSPSIGAQPVTFLGSTGLS